MQSDQQIYHQKVVPPLAYQVGGSCIHNGSMTPGLGVTLPAAIKHSTPLHGVELQPLEVCPKNYFIFDQTVDRSRIMFHPALAHKFSCPGFDVQATYIENEQRKSDEDKENRGSSSSLKEETEDIDALLSLEEEEQEDGDEVSTARTLGSCGSSSSNSCSTSASKPSKQRLSSVQKLCGSSSNRSSSCNSERKRLRMKKMVKALRGIVPGGDQMSTVAVLDEAVRYLKSLKVEVKRLDVGDLKM